LLLGLSEAEERRQLSDLYLFVIEFVKSVRRDQLVTSTAMLYLHKHFYRHSLVSSAASPTHTSPYIIAASCVFLSAKVCYTPVSLKTVAEAYFNIEKKKNPSKFMHIKQLSLDRELYYRELFE
jgi:hypothetical protein